MQAVESLYGYVESLYRIVEPLCAHQYYTPRAPADRARHVSTAAGYGNHQGERVWYHLYPCIGKKAAAPRARCQPAAYSHKCDRHAAIKLTLSQPRTVRNIRHRRARAMYHRTKATSSACGITGALAGMMAYSGHVPHVVHSPNDFPTHGRYTCYLPQAQRALVNPRQDDDISLTNKRMTMQRKTRGGCRHLEQIRTVETVMQKYVGTFAQKSGFLEKTFPARVTDLSPEARWLTNIEASTPAARSARTSRNVTTAAPPPLSL